MMHWTDFLCFAVCHAEAMKYTQIALDPMAMVQAMQAAQQQHSQLSGILSAPNRFDPRLVTAR